MRISLSHLGIACKDPERFTKFLEVLGIHSDGKKEIINSEKIEVEFFPLPASSPRLEILHPFSSKAPIKKFLDKKGSGVHHLAFEVEKIDSWIQRFKEQGFEFTGEAPKPGAEGTRVAFLHPRSTGGFLIELLEISKKGDEINENQSNNPSQ